jgi:hypothetical protein
MKDFRRGEQVLIECDGQKVPGTVFMASGNGKSLMLQFEAILDGHLGMMPVSRNDDGTYESLMTGIGVKLSSTTKE